VALANEKLSLSFPVKVGLSLSDYYEGEDGDSTFGYLSTGAVASVPLAFIPPQIGSWTARGGIEVLTLGDSLEAINGDAARVIGSFGFGVSY
jgi:hypothetical protein